MTDRLADAIACFRQMRSELAQGVEQANWTLGERKRTQRKRHLRDYFLDFQSRCCKKLEVLADNAMNAERYEEAISLYTLALSLNPVVRQDLLVKRSKACAGKGMWEDALDDANEVACS